MQLVAYGAQDVYLTGNPQITFFKVVYRRHTNFAMESIEQVFNGSADWNKKVTCTISRNGDLIHRTYLRVQLPDVSVPPDTAFRWLNYVGQTMIKSVELEIGGMRIDKHYGDWMHIWNELTQTSGKQLGYGNMVGNMPSLVNPKENPASTGYSVTVAGQILYIPLEFWFCRNPGLALPLIALQYHEVKINLEISPATDCYWAATGLSTTADPTTVNMSAVSIPSIPSASLFVDYIYLDTDERRRFAQVSHEYLIEQLQFTGAESTSSANTKIKLNFNHPTKEIVWVVQPDDNVAYTAPYGKQWFNYTDAYDTTYAKYTDPTYQSMVSFGIEGGSAAGGANHVYQPASFDTGENPVSTAILQLNGHDRFTARDGRYFNLVQPYQHHENVPSKGINVYSFGLKPEEYQPSGTCNFSRIDTATLNINLTKASINTTRIVAGITGVAGVTGVAASGTSGQSGYIPQVIAVTAVTGTPSTTTYPSARSCQIRVYAINYNVLRIMSGMGGLAYSN